MRENLVHVASVTSKTGPVVKCAEVVFEELDYLVGQHVIGAKDGPAWMPALIEPGPRQGSRVQSVSLLVLDVEAKAQVVDGKKTVTGSLPPSPEEMVALMQERKVAGYVITSYSHGNGLGPRYRVIALPHRSIRPDELKSALRGFAEWLGVIDCVDTSATDPARLFFLPRVPGGASLEASRTLWAEGAKVHVDSLLKPVIAPQRQQAQAEGSVIDEYNKATNVVDLLAGAGYTHCGGARWLWSGSTSGIPGVCILSSGLVFSHHPGDPLHGEHAHDAFSLFTTLNHAGNIAGAVKAAAAQLGMTKTKAAIANAVDWPQLDPLPDPQSLYKSPEAFPTDALGPIAGPAAAAIAAKVQAPGAIAAGSVLAALALSTQALADVVLPHGARSPLSLAVITAAGSGDRKSATDQIACAPIEEFRRQQYRLHAREMKAYRSANAPKGERTEPPVAKSLTVSKGTCEGLTKQLRHQSHIGLFSPDGGDVLGGHSMQAERRAAGIAWYLKAWGGEPLDNLTSGEGLMAVTGRRLTMHLLVQPVVLQKLMADPLAQGQGLIARCLIAAPDTLAGTRLFRRSTTEDEANITALHQRIAELLALPPRTHPEGDGLELSPRQMRLDEQATALWIGFHDEVELRQAPGSDLANVRPWASKAAEQAARIAAILAVCEGSDAVLAHHMVSGIRVASFYLTEHLRLTSQSVEFEHSERLHALLAFLRERGPRITREEVLQHAPRIIRSLKAEGINPLWEELVERGYMRKAAGTWEIRQ
jgi:hypothetical protein